MIDASRFKRSFPAYISIEYISVFLCAMRLDDTSWKAFDCFQKKEEEKNEEENTLANLWLARTVIKLSIRWAIFFPFDSNTVYFSLCFKKFYQFNFLFA